MLLDRWGVGIFDLGLSIIGFTLLILNNSLGFLFLGIHFIHTIYVTYILLIGEYKDGFNKFIPYPGQKIKN